MDSSFISVVVQNIWNAWNIRGFMILSLCMQLVLAMTAPFRRKTSNSFFIFVVWSAYLLADWGALFASGLISNAARQRNSNNNAEFAPDVMAFWAAFLLIHLGGPDTITAFSLEDNALWLRHLAGLIGQLFVFLYIFAKTLPHNKLLIPTTLIFVAGSIKCGERIRALYLASMESLKKSIMNTTSDNGSKCLHSISKCLIADIPQDLLGDNQSSEFFSTKCRDSQMNLIYEELHFLFDVLYTKLKAAKSRWGILVRGIAYFSTLAAFILFCLADKQEFHEVDIGITYALLGGVFILHVSNLLMVLTSSLRDQINLKDFILLAFGQGFLPFLVAITLYSVRKLLRESATKRFLDRKWSEKMGSFNLLSYCFKHGASARCQKSEIMGSFNLLSYCFKQGASARCQKSGFIWNKLTQMRHTSWKNFHPDLYNVVFNHLKRKTEGIFPDKEKLTKLYKARGDWALEESLPEESRRSKLKHYINNFKYDHTLLIWHVATEICYNIEENNDAVSMQKTLSKVLSDYMMYLLVKHSKLMTMVTGITHIRYEQTCNEAKFRRWEFSVSNMHAFCKQCVAHDYGITEHDDDGITKHDDDGLLFEHSVLKDSIALARLIGRESNKWEIIFNVWIELLLYAAGHCKADSHARLLSEGGEFISFVWMLMAFLGLHQTRLLSEDA